VDLNLVSQRFIMLTDISPEELEKWMPLIEDSEVYVKSLLRDSVNIDSYSRELSSAVGAYAYYKWSLITSKGEAKSFKAGDVSITETTGSSQSDEALKVWKNALDEIAFLTKDRGFYFRGVSV
jgi:hypothetical protein